LKENNTCKFSTGIVLVQLCKESEDDRSTSANYKNKKPQIVPRINA